MCRLYDAANATNGDVPDPDWEVAKLRNILIVRPTAPGRPWTLYLSTLVDHRVPSLYDSALSYTGAWFGRPYQPLCLPSISSLMPPYSSILWAPCITHPSAAVSSLLTVAFQYTAVGLMGCTWNCFGVLQEIEKFTGSGVNANVHGTSGRVPVRMSPENATASGAARKFIDGGQLLPYGAVTVKPFFIDHAPRAVFVSAALLSNT